MKTTATTILLILIATTALAVDCTRGNPSPPQAYTPDKAGGDVRFAMLLTPEGINCCDGTFQPEEATFFLHADPDEWATGSIWFAIHEAVWDNSAEALVPGAESCHTADGWVVNVDIPGEYQIKIPLAPDLPGFEDCPPFASDQPWFLVFHVDFGDSDILLDVGTAGPAIADAYYLMQDGGPWLDLVDDLGWYSGPVMNVGVVCTSEPVATETRSWSELKARYR